ncbi:adenine deaminase [bacterium]|jgi:adenine deaminase|nr:adenine deaminase [bacterium]
MKIKGNIIDIHNREIFYGEIEVEHQKIKHISKLKGNSSNYILPGFTDAHVHIESSMLIPSEFARIAVVHGTIATVSDPHEIANVLGIEGVNYMIENGKKVPLKFNFGAPSCVPATRFETAGAEIDVAGIQQLLEQSDIKYLAEMMNYPGVIFEDESVLSKISTAKKLGKPIDGHAPGVRGEHIKKYISAGISTDHECFTYEEALEKLELGMKILIREGSAAKNFEALIELLPNFADRIMFCSDDKHPDELIAGHINQLVARALKKGYDLFDVLKVACINPVKHYSLEVGLLQVGDFADFIVTDDLENFNILQTYINGELVAEMGLSKIQSIQADIINNFNISSKKSEEFSIEAKGDKIQVIKAINGEIITQSFTHKTNIKNGLAIANSEKDILKIAVINRYENEPPALAFINGFNIKNGAIASCVGHDSHNIIAVGTDDDFICKAVNLIIQNKGGISAVSNNQSKVLPLPIAGIMTNEDGYSIAKKYAAIDAFVKDELDTKLTAPFMTLSFMALLVIPSLKLGDKGLFDGDNFEFTALFSD